MAPIGRPPTCGCGKCARCKRRVKAREAYQALSVAERKALIGRRDPKKVRAADKARYYRDPEKRQSAARALEQKNPQYQERKKRWIERNPEKRAANVVVGNALRSGRLVKGPCEMASGGSCGKRIEAHHDDYSKPLEVRWLCSKHHAELRRQAEGEDE